MKISDSPSLKRRRCAETTGLTPAQPVTDPTTNSNIEALSSCQTAGEPILDGFKPSSSSNFDPKVFTAFTGEELSLDILRRLEDVSGGDMERAINMYFDGSWKSVTDPQSLLTLTSSRKRKESSKSIEPLSVANLLQVEPVQENGDLISMPEKRYIGAFGVAGWATKSGTGIISHGESIRLERQRQVSQIAIARKATSRKTKGKREMEGKGPVAPGRNPPMRQRKTQDIVVRFTNSKGEEVGRLPQDTAAFVSTLIDQHICSFEGLCVYAPDRTRTNDTINLQLRCFMLKRGFEQRSIQPIDTNRAADIFAIKETDDEKALRLRQVALVRLFQEIDLEPSVTNATTTKHKRAGILQAAEMAEQYEAAGPEAVSSAGKEVSEGEKEEGKELEQDQLDQLYRKAQLFDFDYPETEPADTFAMDLRRYQKQALHWFLNKEKNISERDDESMHPLWEEYIWPIKDENDAKLPRVIGKDRFYVNPYSGELSLEFPRQEQKCLGGILADEMGLGKTIEMLSLIHSHKSDLANSLQFSSKKRKLPSFQKVSSEVEPAPCTTLVIAPMSLLSQWQSEAGAASKPGTLETLIYYGSEKKVSLKNICSIENAATAPNLIITSYGTVLSEYTQISKMGGNRGLHGGLFSVKFFRIILDEGHHIKNRSSKTARACYELSAEHRWVLTGTPIVNRLEDLFSLVRFLRVEPWSNFSFWKTFITVPFEAKDFLRALDVVQTVLEPLVLRRTKEMRTPDGMPLVPLPPKKIIIEKIILSKAEREVYDHLRNRAKQSLAHNLEAGTLMKSYTSILAQILRLRQSCCHPTLIRKKEIVEDELEAEAAYDAAKGFSDDMDLNELIDRFSDQQNEENFNIYGVEILKQIRDEAEHECPVCFSAPMDVMTVTGCYHAACKECWMNVIERGRKNEDIPKCVICREAINERDLFEVVRHQPNKTMDGTCSIEDMSPLEITLRRVNSRSSAKIEALIKKLKQLRKEEPNTKSTVFSQFTSFIDLIEPALKRERITFFRFDGSMQQQQRTIAIDNFRTYEGAAVLIISLRAGGVGLNLTEAKRVFMMDPWWSFAVEAQAIDRVHRMGQTQEVIVHRFIVEGSVEERMVNKIQAKKKFIASSLGMMNDDEKRQARIDDIKDLLND